MDRQEELLAEYETKVREVLENYRIEYQKISGLFPGNTCEQATQLAYSSSVVVAESSPSRILRRSLQRHNSIVNTVKDTSIEAPTDCLRPSSPRHSSARRGQLSRNRELSTEAADKSGKPPVVVKLQHKGATEMAPEITRGITVDINDKENLWSTNASAASGRCKEREDVLPEKTHATESSQDRPRGYSSNPTATPTKYSPPAADETVYLDATQMLEKGCYSQNTAYALSFPLFSRRKAKRRLGKRLEKRLAGSLDEFPDYLYKKSRKDQVENYLAEYRRRMEETAKNGRAEALDSEHLKKVEEERRQRKLKHKKYKKIKEKLRDYERKEEEARQEELEKLAQERQRRALELAAKEKLLKEIMDEKKKLEEENSQLKAVASRPVLQPPPIFSGPLNKPNSVSKELKIYTSKLQTSQQHPQNINDFFQSVKKDYLDKINQTVISREALLEHGEVPRPKAIFSETVHQPKQPVQEAAATKPHALYKQSIDSQASQEATPASGTSEYIPKTFIPHYFSEDEFEAGDKKFMAAPFTIDPKLLYAVRQQDHAAIRRFFGNQREIDVEKIFNKVSNVTNWSPNKFTRK